MWIRVVVYLLVGIGVAVDWDILGLLVFVLVMRGVFGLTSSVSHDFLLVFPQTMPNDDV